MSSFHHFPLFHPIVDIGVDTTIVHYIIHKDGDKNKKKQLKIIIIMPTNVIIGDLSGGAV